MSGRAQLAAFALVVASLVCVDRFARVSAWAFLRAEGVFVRLDSDAVFWCSLWYTVPFVTFLAIHEGGHLLTAWASGVKTSGPYFLPMPVALMAWSGLPLPAMGSLGAFVRIGVASHEDRWRIALMGPALGLCFAAACVCIGSVLSGHGEGLTVYVPHVLRPFTDGAIWHPMLLAGYVGVLVTGLNLVPFPGLDGWHLLTTFEHLNGWRRACTLAAWGCACMCLA